MEEDPNDSNINAQEIYSMIFMQAAEGILVLNNNYIIKLLNTRAENILGYNKGELNNQEVNTIIPVKFHKAYQNLFADFFKKKYDEKGKKKITFLRKDGSKINVEISISYNASFKKSPLLVILFSEIRKRYHPLTAPSADKNLYENPLSKMTSSFISLDHNWRYKNNALRVLEELKTENTSMLKVTMGSHLMPNPRLGAPPQFKDGTAVFPGDAETHKVKPLPKSEESFVKVFRSSPVALSISRLSDKRFVDVNNSFLNLFGFSHSDVIGKTIPELGLYKNTRLEKYEQLINLVHNKKSIRNFETTSRKKTGETIYIQVSIEIIDLNGEESILATIIDITETKETKDAMRRVNELLEKRVREKTIELTEALEKEKEINDMKSRFVSMASHEFRTPLTGLLTSISIIEQYIKPQKNQKLLKHFNRINSSVRTLTEILTHFLSLDKLDQEKITITNNTINLPEFIREIIVDMSATLRKGQYITYNHHGRKNIYQDKKIIYNTLSNLLSNASKYSDELKAIELYSVVKDNDVIISVSDAGIGIPADDQQNLFTRFFRAKNAETIQGTGLGLSIVKKYMELIGGTICFESKENEGSIFTVRFPKKASKE